MRRRFYILILSMVTIAIFIHQPGLAQSQENVTWDFQILEADQTGMVVELTIQDFDVEMVTHAGVTYQRLSLPDWGRWGQVGLPDLPVYRVPIGLPYPGQPTVTILAAESDQAPGYLLYPTPEFTLDEQATTPTVVETFTLDSVGYAADTQYPGALVDKTSQGQLRNQPIFSLALNPFQYNPAQQTLEIYRRLRVEITFPPAPQGRTIATDTTTPPIFTSMINRVITNEGTFTSEQLATEPQARIQRNLPSDATYVIITHPDFTEAIQELADYRTSQGETVAVVETTDLYQAYSAGVKSSSAIKAYLTEGYNTWTVKPVYALLVGDADADAVITDPDNDFLITGYDPDLSSDYLPAYYETLPLFGPAPLDAWYERITLEPGTNIPDPYPDIIVGRIPAQFSSDVSRVVDKIITYEQSPSESSWMRKAVLVADDHSPFDNDIDDIATVLPDSLNVTTMYDHSANTSVQSEIGSGALLVAYSGHGNHRAWGEWINDVKIFEKSDVTNLFNNKRYPFLTVANCANGYFADPRYQVLAEEFLLASKKGSIATWAATIFAFPTVNTPLHQELHETIFEDEVYTLGVAAATARISAYTANSHLSLKLFESFAYLGDPAVRLSMPASFSIAGTTSPDPVTMGSNITYDLTYTVAGQFAARDLRLVVTLPDHTTFQSATISPSTINGQRLVWQLGDVAPGSQQISVTTKVNTSGLDHNEVIVAEVEIDDDTGGDQEISLQNTVQDQPITNLNASNDGPTELEQATQFSATVDDGSNVIYTWDFDDGSSPKTGASVQHTYANIGTYQAEVTASNGANTTMKTTTVTVVDAPPQAIFVTSAPDRLNQITTFQSVSEGTNLDLQWNFGDGTTGTGTSPSHDYTTIGMYTVVLTATNSVGVSVSSQDIEIQEDVRPPMADFISSSPDELGSITMFTNNSDDGADDTPNVSYLWQFGDGNSSTNVNPNHTYSQVGNYNVQLTITNSEGNDTKAATISVVDVTLTGLSFSQSSPTPLGTSTTFNAATTAGTNVTYTWDFGDGSGLETGSSAQHTYATVGTYIVSLTAANSVSSDTVTGTVTIIDVAITGLSANNDGPHFITDAQTLLSANIASGTNVVYEWDFGDGSPVETGATVAHVYPAVGTYQAQVVASNSLGQQTETTTVTIRDTLPLANFTTSSPDPLGEMTQFFDTSNGSNLAYAWDFGDGHFTDVVSPSHTYEAIGIYTVVLTVSNSVATHSRSGIVEITDAPTLGLTSNNDSPTPVGETTTFSASVASGSNVTYTWDFLDGTDPVTGTVVSHAFAIPGTYQVNVTAMNGAGSVTISDTVVVSDAPIVGLTASNDGPTPLGEETAFTADATSGTNIVYTWDFGDDSPGQTGQMVSHTYADLGVYVAQVTAENGVDTQSTTTLISVVDAPPQASFDTSSPDLLGQETTFNSTSGGSNLTYTWDFGDGSPILSNGSSQVSHTYQQLGFYTVILTASNSLGSDSTTQIVEITDTTLSPVASFTSSSPDELGQTTTFVNTSQDGGEIPEMITYVWDFGDGQTSQVETPTHMYTAVGTYTVALTITNRSGSDKYQDTVTITDVPISGLSMIVETGIDGSTVLSATVNAGTNITYQWDFGDASSSKQGQYVDHLYEESGTYLVKLTATNSVGSAMAEKTILIQVLAPPTREMYMPLIMK
ncbi:MAG: PKD domain-containing protein [Chloroflexota bacterium]